LAVFGYPIAAPSPEINRDDGQPYQTQWFERNRFELHPENTAPYDVLLGRLGDDRLRWQSVDWQALPAAADPQAGCLWFAQTSHAVCDQADGRGFQTYWRTHGLHDPRLTTFEQSLALFGLPLSEATIEVNPTDGQPYLTQWFERARFEWHPNEPDAYSVLLGLLGNQLHLKNGRRISAALLGQPAGHHPLLYWTELQSGRAKLFGTVVDTRGRLLFSDQVDPAAPLATTDLAVAWVMSSSTGRQQRVQYYALPGHAPLPVIEKVLLDVGSGSLQITGMALGSGMLYYADATPDHRGLFARSIANGHEELIDPAGLDPVATNGVVLWSRRVTNGQTGTNYRETWSLHLRRLDYSQDSGWITSEERIVTRIESDAPGRFSGYSASGDAVVWAFAAPGADNRVYLYQISGGTRVPISLGAASSPSIDNSRVAWATDASFDTPPSSTWSVQSYQISSGTTQTIASGMAGHGQRFVAQLGDHVAFTIDNPPANGDPALSQSLYLADVP
ncbi:MAG TPA: hypothetical protein VFU22_27110, partial [Roseiflexaceae bacterium]|nr:hypothetical protein [Roseiflexaceae bacterium]